jgi:glycosyltransferase involved in cell wall biosynthesis
MSAVGLPALKVAFLTTDNRDQLKDYTAATPCFGPAPEALLEGLALLPDVEVHIVSCGRKPMSAPEKLASNIFYHLLYVPKPGWMRTLFQGCVRAVRKKLKEIRPDIVHGQGTEGHNSLAAIFSGFPNVLTIHGNMRLIAEVIKPSPLSYNWLAARLEGFTIPRSQGVVCITRYTQAAVSDLARATWVVPNAVDSSFFEINAQPLPTSPPQILCVGFVCMRKNQNAFIRSLDALAQRRKFELVFLGVADPNDAYSAEFVRLVRERSWCTHAGFADRAQLKTRLHQASALVLPSLEDNCPMVVLEAMASGVPVVAARVGGVPDLIEEGETGSFCDPHDPASMRGAVEKALSNPGATADVARRAKLRAQERFHPRVIARRHVEIYQEVLGRHRRA